MILEVYWDDLWTLSSGLSQFYGHGSRLVCEVALSYGCALGTIAHYIRWILNVFYF